VAKDAELTSTTVAITEKLPPGPMNTRRGFRRRLLERMLRDMLISRFNELALAANPPLLSAGATTGRMVATKNEFTLSATVKQDGVERGLAALAREFERVRQHGFTASELQRAQINLRRSYEIDLQEVDKRSSADFVAEAFRYFMGEDDMAGSPAALALVGEFLASISLHEVNQFAASLFRGPNRVVTVTAPEAAVVPPPSALLSVLAAPRGETLAAWQDNAKEGPLTEALPPPGRIVRERALPEVGATEWLLSNGVRVLLKPTDFRKEEINVQVWSNGGSSHIPTSDLTNAQLVGDVILSAGIGRFKFNELRKALAGKQVSLALDLQPLAEGWHGSASPQDLEALLQLGHLAVTAPRRDDSAFDAVKQAFTEEVMRRGADPRTVYSDRWTEVFYQDHPRRRPTSAASAARADRARILRLYHQRFDVLDGLNVVMVGALDLARVRPLVEKYFGALRTTGRQEGWRDDGARLTTRPQRFEVRRGHEDKAQVGLVFFTAERYQQDNEFRLRSLGEILQNRMYERLRTKLGGVYGVSVATSTERWPRGYYHLDVDFSCAPDRTEALIAAVKEEIAQARSTGFTADEIATLKANQRRWRAEAQRTNDYWLQRLVYIVTYQEAPGFILAGAKMTESLDAPALLAAARKYLDQDRLLVGLLTPEAPPPVAANAKAAKATAGAAP
jgi:zinc protease